MRTTMPLRDTANDIEDIGFDEATSVEALNALRKARTREFKVESVMPMRNAAFRRSDSTQWAQAREPQSQNDLKNALEQELTQAIQVLQTHHQQALTLVDKFCTDATSQPPAPDGFTKAPVAPHTLPAEMGGPRVKSVQFLRSEDPAPLVSKTSTKLFDHNISGDANSSRKSMATGAHFAVVEARALAKEQPRVENKNQVQAVFVDAAAMKEKVKLAVMKPEYDVMNFYHTTGVWQRVARSFIFENLTLFVIGVNSVWIAIETDYNSEASWLDADLIFKIADNFFCTYFTGEILIRFMAFKRKRNCLRDAWFVFDSCLVVMMVLETWVMVIFLVASGSGSGGGLGDASLLRLVRLLRLTRMARMARLLRAMPELMILVKGMLVATRSVFFTLCLLAIFLYVFAIAFTQLCEKNDLGHKYFPNVPASMNTLLLDGIFADLADFVNDCGAENYAYAVLLLFFVLLTLLTVMNMLVGVLVEVVSVVSAVEKEQMTVQFVKTKLLAMLQTSGIDQDGNKHISKCEFDNLLLNPQAARIIQEIGVDVVGLVDFSDHIFEDGERELSFPDFMELVLQLRGTNTATVRDMVDLRKFVANTLSEMAGRIAEMVHGSEDRINMRMAVSARMSMMSAQASSRRARNPQITDSTDRDPACSPIKETPIEELSDNEMPSNDVVKAYAREKEQGIPNQVEIIETPVQEMFTYTGGEPREAPSPRCEPPITKKVQVWTESNSRPGGPSSDTRRPVTSNAWPSHRPLSGARPNERPIPAFPNKWLSDEADADAIMIEA